MGQLRVALGAAAFFVIAPGTVAGLVPFALTRWKPSHALPAGVRGLGVLLVVAGLVSLAESFVRFVVRGRGTPAPEAPPRRLVVSGQYRYVRNPMYVAVVIIVLGQAVLLGSGSLLAYAAVLSALFHLRVLRYEEPRLAVQFGAEYRDYCRRVPRWLPRARGHGGEVSGPEEKR